MLSMFLIMAGVFVIFSFIQFAQKKKKPFLRAFLIMLIGTAALFAVNLISAWTGVYIPVTRLTLLTSAIGGVPGVALLVLLISL